MQDAVTPEAPPKPPEEGPKPSDPPTPVFLKQSGGGVLSWLPSLARPAAEVAATLLLVAVLTTFMLVQRATTRDRLLGLARRRQLTTTTRALDDAAERVGRFLLLQAATNAAMGLIMGVGLALIGVPYAPLWGMLTAGLRFLPYVGIWLSALFPFAWPGGVPGVGAGAPGARTVRRVRPRHEQRCGAAPLRARDRRVVAGAAHGDGVLGVPVGPGRAAAGRPADRVSGRAGRAHPVARVPADAPR